MSDLKHNDINADVGRSSEAEEIFTKLRSLREQIVTAWTERGVVLSRAEQVALHAEIKKTCDYLTALTPHP